MTGPAVPLPASATTLMRRSRWNCAADFVNVRCHCIGGGQASAAGLEIGALNDMENVLNRLAMQSARAANAFEAVVLRRIVAAGDHDGAVRVQVLRGIIEHRRRHRADICNVAAHGPQTLDQRVAKARGAKAAVASDIDVCASARAAADRFPTRAPTARRQGSAVQNPQCHGCRIRGKWSV